MKKKECVIIKVEGSHLKAVNIYEGPRRPVQVLVLVLVGGRGQSLMKV